MKTLKIRRPQESINKYFSYEIFIGVNKITELKNGEEKSIEIPSHLENDSLYAQLLWCGSKKINLKDFESTNTLLVSGSELLNRRIPLLIGLFPLIGISLFSRMTPLMKYIGIGILSMLLLLLIATLTIGRDKWLKIESKD
ncbi:MAG: hypothetical protein RBT49_12930 [Bacteroidales bacterium]|jgi:hypothetical protein|nr:hypothetical protein [Bacteroidales bacterium]